LTKKRTKRKPTKLMLRIVPAAHAAQALFDSARKRIVGSRTPHEGEALMPGTLMFDWLALAIVAAMLRLLADLMAGGREGVAVSLIGRAAWDSSAGLRALPLHLDRRARKDCAARIPEDETWRDACISGGKIPPLTL
jgi:hypothetical protein